MKCIEKLDIFTESKEKIGVFRCPVCRKEIILPIRKGSAMKSCTRDACRKVMSSINLCGDVCSVCDCEWLLEGKPVKGWIAHKVLYDGNETGSDLHKYTYRVKECPKFKKGKVIFSERDLLNLQKRSN